MRTIQNINKKVSNDEKNETEKKIIVENTVTENAIITPEQEKDDDGDSFSKHLDDLE